MESDEQQREPLIWRTWHLAAAAAVALILGLVVGIEITEDDGRSSAQDGAAISAARDSVSALQSTLPPTTATSTTRAPTTTATTATTVATTTTAPPQPVDIVTFTGSSDKNTETFAVRGPWRIRWRLVGGLGAAIRVYNQSGTRVEYIDADTGEDETIIRRSCVCYLEIVPFGSSYTITVNGVEG